MIPGWKSEICGWLELYMITRGLIGGGLAVMLLEMDGAVASTLLN